MTINMLEKFGVTEEEYAAFEQTQEFRKRNGPNNKYDTRICVCGHRRSSHTSEATEGDKLVLQKSGHLECRSGKLHCPCNEFRPVLKVENTRVFNFKSTGHGLNHALFLGLSKAVKEGQDVSWLPEAKCEWCEISDGRAIYPIIYDIRGNEATGHIIGGATRDFLVCDEHRSKILASRTQKHE